MNIRQPYAPNFYSGDIKYQIEDFLSDFQVPHDIPVPVAGVVPHAGWVFSGGVAAKVFSCFKEKNPPDTIILFGSVHNITNVRRHSVYPDGAWSTPVGDVEVDAEMSNIILNDLSDLVVPSYDAHDWEHSLEVQIPFIKYLLPDAKIVPIAVLPGKDSWQVGGKIAGIAQKSETNIVAVGSTDLTHYGSNYGFSPAGSGEEAKEWMIENDRKIIDKALNLEAETIVEEARQNRNSCGSGALSATAAFAKGLGREKGYLLEHITSFDIMPDPVFTMAVGYAGIIY